MRSVLGTLAHRVAGRWRAIQAAHQPANITLYTAMTLTVLMGVAGTAVDYGIGILDAARVQNAADAAALAGARAMVVNSGGQAAADAGRTAAANYLALHGYTHNQNGATVSLVVKSQTCPAWAGRTWNGTAWNTGTWTCPPANTSIWPDIMTVDITHTRQTWFWKMLGINETTVTRAATAAAGADLVDVMLSLDLSASMYLSGYIFNTDDLGQLRSAVVDFIDQMQVDTTQVRGAKVGIARWAGIKCSWWRGTTSNNPPSPGNQGADGDQYIDLDHGPGGSSTGEVTTPCADDKSVLTNLTNDRARLVKIANNTGGITCPASAVGDGCPLQSPPYVPPVVYGTPTTASNIQRNNSNQSFWSRSTGTKLPNAITAVSSGSYHAWSTANGGRNDPNAEGVARKVLVLMTDGFNEASEYGIPSAAGNTAAWDTEAVNAARALELGPDGTRGTPDDVEIFVVGFFCTPQGAAHWCASRLADTTMPHPCPGPTWPTATTPSAVDTLLRNMSSSTSGTCDHYFPIKKTEDLPRLFRILAGSVARSRLQ